MSRVRSTTALATLFVCACPEQPGGPPTQEEWAGQIARSCLNIVHWLLRLLDESRQKRAI